MKYYLATALMLMTTSAFAIGEPVCSPPDVKTETEACPNDHILTYMSATNKCSCPVTITARIQGSGSTYLTIQGRSSGRQMIRTCSSEKGAITSVGYEWKCPEPTKPKASKPEPSAPAIKQTPSASAPLGKALEGMTAEERKAQQEKIAKNKAEREAREAKELEKIYPRNKEIGTSASELEEIERDYDRQHPGLRAEELRAEEARKKRIAEEKEERRRRDRDAKIERDYREIMRQKAEDDEILSQPGYTITIPSPSYQQSAPNPYRQYLQQQQQAPAPSYQAPSRPAPGGRGCGGGDICR